MNNNQKIKLERLKLQSFVTAMEDRFPRTARGGVRTIPLCEVKSVHIACLSQGAQICSDDSC